MPTAQDVLNLARSQLGICENPLGSNSGTPYHAWYGSYCQGWQWCAIFVSWVIWHIDQALFYGLMTAYSGDYLSVGRMHLRGIDISQIAPGDICIWDRPPFIPEGITDHIGFVESVTGSTFTTIEGNSGDCVKRNTHDKVQTSSCHYYFVRPNYTSTPKPQEDDMGLAQTEKQLNTGESWETSGFVLEARKARTDLDLINRGTAPMNVSVGIQKPNGDFGAYYVVVPVSKGDPGKTQGMKNLEVGEAYKDKNLGNIILWIHVDQPATVIKSQELL